MLNNAGAWSTAATVGTTDVAVWSGTYNTAGSLSVALGGAVSWGGIRVGTLSGTAAGLVSIGGTGAAASAITIGSSGIDMSAASHNLVVNATAINLNVSQTFNIKSGLNLRFGTSGTGSANANVDGSSASAVITISGSGVFDANQGGSGGFSDAAGYTGFAGKWVVDSGATLRGLRNGATAWGANTAADTVLLKGGTLAVGGISGSQGDWTWTSNIRLAAGTSSFVDNQIFTGNDRYLKLNGSFSSESGAATTLTFREITDFSNIAKGFIITGSNANLSGTVNIGTGSGNGVNVRLGGISGNNTATTAGTGGDLGTASVVIAAGSSLNLTRSDSWNFSNNLSGGGVLHIGNAVATASTQVVILSGTNTYSGGTELRLGTLTVDSIARLGTNYLAVKGGSTFNYTGGSESTTRSLFFDAGAANVNVTEAATVLTWSDSALKNGAFTKGGAGTLALSGAFSAGASITVNAGTLSLSGANAYTAGTVIASGATLEIAGSGTLANTAISGAGSLRKSGAGTLTLSSTSNSYTGGTSVTNGTLTLGAAGVLADTGAFTVSGGTFDLGGFAETVGSLSLTSGTIQNGTLTSGAAFDLSGGTVAASAVLAGSVGLNKTGAGSATVSGTHTYSGATTVSNGTLILAAGASVASNSFVIANGATLETADTFTLGAGKTLSLGSGSTVATANKTGAFTLDGGTLAIDFGASTNDILAVSGDLALNSGTVNFVKSGSYTGGTYDVITYGGAFSGDTLGLTLSGLSSDGTSRQTFDFVNDAVAQKVQLIVGGKAEDVRWTAAVDSIWNAAGTGVANWQVTDAEYVGDQPNRFFNGDVVIFGDSATSGNVVIDVADVLPGSVVVNAETLAYSIGGTGVIASGDLSKSGAASLTLTGANTFTGGTTLSAGRIRLGVDNALGSGTIAASGGSLSSDGADARALSNAIEVSAGLTLGDATDTGALTLSGAVDLKAANRTLTLLSDVVLSGSVANGSLTKAGGGKLTFTGNNVLRTALDVTAGTVALGSSNAVNDSANLTVRSGATLDLGGFTDTLGDLTLETGTTVTSGTLTAGAVTIGDSVTFGTINLTAASVSTTGTSLAPTLLGTTALTKSGTGVLDLAAASTRSGSTTVTSGGIRVGNDAALGTGTLALNGGRLTPDATGRTLANATTVGGNVSLGETGAGLLTFSNTFNLGGGNRTLTVDSAVRLSGAVSNGTLTKAGNGTLTLSATNTHTATVIQAGKIEMVGTVNSLGSGGVTLSSGAELALSMTAANITVANNFTGTGRVAKNTTNRFFVSGDNSNAVIEWYWGSNDPAGTTGGIGFSNGAAFGGAGSKLKVNDGITASAFINATGQTVAVGVEIDAGGTYQWNGSTANTNTVTGVISGSGTFTKISGETLLFTGVHTHTGALNVNTGTMQIAQSGQLGQGDFGGATSIVGTLYYNSDAAQTLSGAISGAGTLRKGNTSTLVLSGASTFTGQTSVENGTVRLTGSQTGASNTARVVNLATVAGQTASYVVDGGNLSLTGTNSLIVGDVGTGTFTLTSGTVSLGSGGVWVGDASADAVGTLDIQGGSFASSGALVVATRGTGTLNVSGGSASFASISLGNVAGTGQTANVNLGAATVTTGSITGVAAAATRALVLDGSTLRSSASTTTFLQGLSSAAIQDGGVTFDTNGFDITAAQDLSGNAGGSLAKTGLGTLTLSGANSYDGDTTVSAGTLRAGSSGAFGSGAVIVNGGALDLGGQTLANDVTLSGGDLTGSGTLSGALTAASGLTKSGAGSLTLSGANSIASVAITGGSLVAGSASALGSGTITLGAARSTWAARPSRTPSSSSPEASPVRAPCRARSPARVTSRSPPPASSS